MPELLLQIVEALRDSFKLDAAEVWLHDSRVLRPVATDPRRELSPLMLNPSEASIAATLRVSGRPWAQVWLPALLENRSESALRVAPISASSTLLGLIVIERGPRGEDLAGEADVTLEELAREVGVGLNKQRLDEALHESMEPNRRMPAPRLVVKPACVYPVGVPIRLVLAEDNLLVREGVRQLLSTVPDVEVVGTCADRDSLIAAVEAEKPEAVITDIRMPPTNTDEGIQVAARLRQTSPSTGVVVLSQYSDAEYAVRLFDQGAAGRAYLLKDAVSDLEQLVSAIRDVARGGSVVDPKIVEALIANRARKAESPLKSLTPREREVLARVAQGQNNAAIAEGLFLTAGAVEKHINAIFSKLGLSEERNVHRRVKAALIFLAEESPQAGKR